MPKRGHKQDGEPLPERNKRLGVPFVPFVWPDGEKFDLAFSKADKKCMRERDMTNLEDVPLKLSPTGIRKIIINS